MIKRFTAGLLMFIACLMTSINPSPVRAEVLLNERIPISTTFFDECTGEEILITGEAHLQGSITTTKDGRMRRHAHVNLHGTAVGLTSGNEYVINDNFKIREVTEPAECGFKYQDIERIRLISKGTQPNQLTIIGLKLSQNAECQFTSEVTAETDCRG
jgi:hypothetical protein